jgi:hypothetical protein
MRWSILAVVVATSSRAAAEPAELVDEARQLLVAGACAKGETKVKAEIVAEHCKRVSAAQEDYKKSWLAHANPFFRANVPAGLPKTVVYPFAGGDLATALAVYPDADEITTLGLEPAGDPRALGRLREPELKRALGVVATELENLYRSSFSKTMNMFGAMGAGSLPTQLVFSLSALHIHGYELVGVRYFKLDGTGGIVYFSAADLDRLAKVQEINQRNHGFGNVEIRFRKPGSKREQVYRHIAANLDNKHLEKWSAPVRHLQKKGRVAGMTKAASYLLSFGDFSTIRKYLIDHVEWMVSDTTGIPPSYGVPEGFVYETWGEWKSSNMDAGNGAVRATWKELFASKPRRELAFRFGYPNGDGGPHMVFARRGPKPTKK